MSRDWDAATYDRVSDVQAEWAREVPFEIDAEIKRRMLNGLDDIGVTLSNEELISAYEAERERPGPVTTAL